MSDLLHCKAKSRDCGEAFNPLGSRIPLGSLDAGWVDMRAALPVSALAKLESVAGSVDSGDQDQRLVDQVAWGRAGNTVAVLWAFHFPRTAFRWLFSWAVVFLSLRCREGKCCLISFAPWMAPWMRSSRSRSTTMSAMSSNTGNGGRVSGR